MIYGDLACRIRAQDIEAAQRLWVQRYGAARTPDRPERQDSGTQRKRLREDEAGKVSLSHWIKKRRAEVNAQARASSERAPVEVSLAQQVGVGGWSEAHEAEADFQRDKRMNRFLEAHEAGHTLEAEYADKELADRAVMLKLLVDEARNRKYNQDRNRVERLLEAPAQVSLEGKRIFVEERVLQEKDAEMRQLVHACNGRLVQNRGQADVFVVLDVQHPGQRVTWHAMLGGHSIADVHFLESSGHAGVMFTYKAATNTTRRWYCSAEFARLHPILSGIIHAKANAPGSKWYALDAREDCIEWAEYCNQRKRATEVLAFVSEAEANAEDPNTEGCGF